jgi:hypothetical protein
VYCHRKTAAANLRLMNLSAGAVMVTDNRLAMRPAPDVVDTSRVTVLGGPSPVLDRLHALVRKGYNADIGTKTKTDVIVLRHLGKAPDLVLHPDGSIEGWDGRRPWHKKNIDAPTELAPDKDGELRFMKFLDTVPKASLRDRTRPWRKKYVYFPVVLIVVWGICMALTALILGS